MKEGTTPKQTIRVKRNLTAAKQILVIYSQNKRMVLSYEIDPSSVLYDSESEETTIELKLTQKEMCRFNAGYANVEVDSLFDDDDVYKSDLALIRITPSLNGIVMEVDEDE